MNLTEWKQKSISEIKVEIKSALTEDYDYKPKFSTTVTKDIFEEARDEWLIESFEERVSFEEEFDFVEEDLEGNLVEEYDFIPNEFGEKMDLEVEFDITETFDYVFLGAVRDMLFAEDYEIIQENDRKAKVVFSRAGGGISKKKKCKKGFKLKGNKCIPQTGTEKAGNRRVGIKIKRAKKAMGGGAKKKASIKAKITKKRTSGKSRNFSNTEN